VSDIILFEKGSQEGLYWSVYMTEVFEVRESLYPKTLHVYPGIKSWVCSTTSRARVLDYYVLTLAAVAILVVDGGKGLLGSGYAFK